MTWHQRSIAPTEKQSANNQGYTCVRNVRTNPNPKHIKQYINYLYILKSKVRSIFMIILSFISPYIYIPWLHVRRYPRISPSERCHSSVIMGLTWMGAVPEISCGYYSRQVSPQTDFRFWNRSPNALMAGETATHRSPSVRLLVESFIGLT